MARQPDTTGQRVGTNCREALTNISRAATVRRGVLVVTAAVCATAFAPGTHPFTQTTFSRDALETRVPSVRERFYTINARVRPLLLFWIGREDVGEARITWREGSEGRRAFELLIGSDPARAPRRVNRWGFMVEELHDNGADIFGVMRESNEKTLAEAEARIGQEGEGLSTFKAVRTMVTGTRAVSGTMTILAPDTLTFHDVDALLAEMPEEPSDVKSVDLPHGTQQGFLTAMDALIRDSIDPCRHANDTRARPVPARAYVYKQDIYDLYLRSCEYRPELQVQTGTFAHIVEGLFQIKNRRTKNETEFRLFYGTSGDLRELPVRALFRPRWWMEIELVLNPSATAS